MIWVVVANTNLYRIYQFDKRESQLTLLKEISHPENKLKKSEYLTSDKPGRYQSTSATSGAYSQQTDPKEVEIENFAREISKELNKGRNNHDYKSLILVSAPHMKGLLMKHLDTHVKDLISHEIGKDVVNLPQHELLDYLLQQLQPG